MKERVVERKGYWLLAASLRDYGFIEEWVLEGRGPVRLPFHSPSNPYNEWRFKSRLDLGDGWWVLKFSMGGSGLLRLDGRAYAGLDNAHTYVLVRGGVGVAEVEATPPTIHGFHGWRISFNYALKARVAPGAFITGLRLLALYDYIKSLDDPELKGEILAVAEDVLAPLSIRATPGQLAVAGMILHDSNWSPWTPRKELPPPRFDIYMIRGLYGEAALRGDLGDGPEYGLEEVEGLARDIWRGVVEGLEGLRGRYRVEGVIHAVAHSHIDTAWLWPYREARRKVLRTNATVAYLAGLYGSIVYIQSPPLHHKWLEDDRGVYGAVKRLEEEGRWIPAGGMWVEGELQIVDGESLARQLLYGQRYYKEVLGRETWIGWLPDNFGYPASLPQLLLDSGIKVLFIQKVLWNDTNAFPHHLFVWRGIDGSTIPVQVIPDNVYAYNNPARPSHMREYWRGYRGAVERVIYPYGYGDGGGGPTLEMVVGVELAKILPGMPKVVDGELEELEASIRSSLDKLPVWSGELYLELHRGTYTTNARIKELTARAESLLRSLDALEAIAYIRGIRGGFQGSEGQWKELLQVEFHDILPGTATPDVYRDVEESLGGVVKHAEERIRRLLDSMGGCGIVVYNDAPWRRSGVVALEGEVDGCQAHEGLCLVYVEEAPPMGYATLKPGGASPEARVYSEGKAWILDNGIVKAAIGVDGLLESLQRQGAEYLAEPSNVLRVHVDEPAEWDAWDIEREALDNYMDMAVLEPPSITARGPERACVSYKLGYMGSWVRQDTCIDRGSPTLDVYTRASWRVRGALVKAWFKPAVEDPRYYFEIPFGYIERGVDELEGAKFESPALRWMAVQGRGRGLAFISSSRHGYGYRGGYIGLSLLKKPVFPNPWTDEGAVSFTYSIYPYMGGLEESGMHRIAFEKWSPLKALYKGCGGEGGNYSLLTIEPQDIVMLSTLKKAEEGDAIIARIYNPYSRAVKARIKLNFETGKAELVNIIEARKYGEALVRDGIVEVRLDPYKIVTIKIHLNRLKTSKP